MSTNQQIQQAVVTDAPLNTSQESIRLALFDENGVPIDLSGGGGEPGEVSWDDIENKPTVIAAGDDAEEARDAIGAGTSNLTVGTGAANAKAGNWNPAVSDVTGLQAILTDLTDRIEALENE